MMQRNYCLRRVWKRQPGSSFTLSLQNGRHEHLDPTLKQATATSPRRTQGAQPTRLGAGSTGLYSRPAHEALAMRTPAQCYSASPRAFPPAAGGGIFGLLSGTSDALEWRDQAAGPSVVLERSLNGKPIGLLATIIVIVQETFSTACYRNDKGRKKNE